MYAFGADIGGTTTKIGIFDDTGDLLDKWEIPTRTQNHGNDILSDLSKSVWDTIKEQKIPANQIVGLGVGVPGAVTADGTVLHTANLGWDTFHVPSVLENLVQLPVKVANDANVAAFGEMWQGGGKGIRNQVMVTLGTGVGGGIIVNGSIVTGAMGAGGEIGHIHVQDGETLVCGCGNTGCLEQYASATGIARLAKRFLQETNEESSLKDKNPDAKAVFDAAKEGDPLANRVVLAFSEYLGKGLAIVAAVVNPEVFVISGGVSKAGEFLLQYIRPAYERYAFPACRGTELKLAQLGSDAGIFGAAGLLLLNK
ncbi:MAG: ROK family glucokinase [Lachnospiraceae bacterium]|jgi:glucokinase|nr:ROK family glucokinase [Lachnospiraceae bacterium]